MARRERYHRRKHVPRYLPIGSMSTATLRAEDVVPELLWAGEHYVKMSQADRRAFNRLRSEARAALETVEDKDATEQQEQHAQETLTEVWSDLENLLTMYAPPGCYVGSHPGDGADIGCWPSEEIPCVCPRVGPVTVEMLDNAAAMDGPGDTVFEVSDHGNILAVWTRMDPSKWHRMYLP